MTESARLFTLRLWPAAESDGDKSSWHGKVQSLPDGEAYHFSDWPDLIRALEAMLSTKLSAKTDEDQ